MTTPPLPLTRRMKQKRKTPYQIRSEAAEICDAWADERASTGDPEGADILREAGKEIRQLSLTLPTPPNGSASCD